MFWNGALSQQARRLAWLYANSSLKQMSNTLLMFWDFLFGEFLSLWDGDPRWNQIQCMIMFTKKKTTLRRPWCGTFSSVPPLTKMRAMALLGDITLYYYDLQSLITQTCALLYYIILYYINLIINNKHYLKRTFFFIHVIAQTYCMIEW